MSREGKSQGGFPGRDDEKNQENRSHEKRRTKSLQRRNTGDVYKHSDDMDVLNVKAAPTPPQK
jgi:hypothetical protein